MKVNDRKLYDVQFTYEELCALENAERTYRGGCNVRLRGRTGVS